MINKTIGTGGNCADIGLSYQYLHSLGALSDLYTFTIISDFTENTGIPVELGNWDGINYNLKTVSFLNPGHYVTTLPNSTKFLYFKATSDCVLIDSLKIDGLIFKLQSGLGAGHVLSSRSHYGDVGITNLYKNITIIGAGKTGAGIHGIRLVYGQGIDKVLNCRVTGVDTGISFVDGLFTTIGHRHYIEDCACYDCGIGVQMPPSSAIVKITVKNTVSSGCAVDFGAGGVHNIVTNCRDSDDSILICGAILSENDTGIVDGDFLSVDPANANFLKINNNSKLYKIGTTNISSWNTIDAFGLPRPDYRGDVSIGVHEPISVDVTLAAIINAESHTKTKRIDL
jgi:hypothetical protein